MTNPTDPPIETSTDHFARAQRLVARAQELDQLTLVYVQHGRDACWLALLMAMRYRRHAMRHFASGIVAHRREIRCQ